jgi:hypothetical protein
MVEAFPGNENGIDYKLYNTLGRVGWFTNIKEYSESKKDKVKTLKLWKGKIGT